MAVWRWNDQLEESFWAQNVERNWRSFCEWVDSLPDSFTHLIEFADSERLCDRWATGLELVDAYEKHPTTHGGAREAILGLTQVMRERMLSWSRLNGYVAQPDPAELVLFEYLDDGEEEHEEEEDEEDENPES